jgi:hypothetical protein
MAPSDNVEGSYTKIVLFPNGKRYLEYTVVDGVLSGPYLTRRKTPAFRHGDIRRR